MANMDIMMMKHKTNSLAIGLIITLSLWQGYSIYQAGFYTKVIGNVIPGSLIHEQNNETNTFNKIFYELTQIDITDYKTIIVKNIPSMQQQVVLGNNDMYNTLTGFEKFKNNGDSEIKEDYFDQNDELRITQFEDYIKLGESVTLDQLKDDSYVTTKLINFDANLNHENQAMNQINPVKLLEKKFKIDTKTSGPKVIIFHTHPQERFSDEEPSGGGVVDVGSYLKKILESQYGVETLHCTNKVEKTPENAAKDDYGRMQQEITKILKENPSIEVAIDIHRDGVGGNQKFSANINGKSAAKLMFVNGFRQVQKQGKLTPIESLPNPYVEDNMALALQIQLQAMEKYPGLMRKTLVKPYRYNLHMRPMSLLLEIGNEHNIKEEALNTIEVFAELLMEVIEKD